MGKGLDRSRLSSPGCGRPPNLPQFPSDSADNYHVEPAGPEPIKNPPIGFKPREFFVGIAVAAAIVFCVAGARWYVRARTPASVNGCIAQLKNLEGAKHTWAAANQKRDQDVPNWSDIVGPNAYIGHMPICPEGGTYTLGPVSDPPRCSIEDHVLP